MIDIDFFINIYIYLKKKLQNKLRYHSQIKKYNFQSKLSVYKEIE